MSASIDDECFDYLFDPDHGLGPEYLGHHFYQLTHGRPRGVRGLQIPDGDHGCVKYLRQIVDVVDPTLVTYQPNVVVMMWNASKFAEVCADPTKTDIYVQYPYTYADHKAKDTGKPTGGLGPDVTPTFYGPIIDEIRQIVTTAGKIGDCELLSQYSWLSTFIARREIWRANPWLIFHVKISRPEDVVRKAIQELLATEEISETESLRVMLEDVLGRIYD
jgi:hypothetical protein